MSALLILAPRALSAEAGKKVTFDIPAAPALDAFMCYVADTPHAVKWRNWKMHYVWQEYLVDIPQKLPSPRLFYLIDDPRERHNVRTMNTWIDWPMNRLRNDFDASLRREPPVPVGTPDPYQPR